MGRSCLKLEDLLSESSRGIGASGGSQGQPGPRGGGAYLVRRFDSGGVESGVERAKNGKETKILHGVGAVRSVQGRGTGRNRTIGLNKRNLGPSRRRLAKVQSLLKKIKKNKGGI